MLKKVALVGITAAAIVGTGTAALAASATSTPSATPAAKPAASAATHAKKAGMKHAGGFESLHGAVKATWVTENKKTSTFITHDAIRGTVTAVSPTSITLSAADKTTETYSIASTTKIHTRAVKKGAVIGDVKVGDTAVVAGTGTTSLAATQILDTAK
jgi:hypothetical protein